MPDMKPSEYLKLVRRDFQKLPANVCDEMLEKAMSADDGGARLFCIPVVSPQYRVQMRSAWTTMIFRILFANSAKNYTLMQRHQILQKTL